MGNVHITLLTLADDRIWWELPNAQRIPYGILVVLALGLRFYWTYRSAKAPRSPRVRRIEKITAISLWSFIGIAVLLLVLFRR
jgi:putative flippase GtrA